jgi:hypothetical protein
MDAKGMHKDGRTCTHGSAIGLGTLLVKLRNASGQQPRSYQSLSAPRNPLKRHTPADNRRHQQRTSESQLLRREPASQRVHLARPAPVAERGANVEWRTESRAWFRQSQPATRAYLGKRRTGVRSHLRLGG